MKKLAFLALLGIIGVAVLGFAAMEDRHGNGTFCLSDIVAPGRCPESQIFSKIFFHSEIYQSFSAAVILAALTLFFYGWSVSLRLSAPLDHSLASRAERAETQRPKIRNQIQKWFEVHEKRDPVRRNSD